MPHVSAIKGGIVVARGPAMAVGIGSRNHGLLSTLTNPRAYS